MLVKYLRALLNPFSTKLDLEKKQTITYSHLVGKKTGYIVESAPINGTAVVSFNIAKDVNRAITIASGENTVVADTRAFRFIANHATCTIEVAKGGYIYINAGDVIQSDDDLKIIWTPFKGRN